MKFHPRVGRFWGCSGSKKKKKIMLKGRICRIFQVSPVHFIEFMRWSSLVELTGDDDSATSTVAGIRMSLKEHAWPSHIQSK